MNYHIYLDGEKCGELTNAETARLRAEVKTDARTWLAFVFDEISGFIRILASMFRMWAQVGGFAFLFVLLLAPDLLRPMENLSLGEMADAIRRVAFYLMFLATLPVAARTVFIPMLRLVAPQAFPRANAFEKEFLRRVRLLKGIGKHGKLEVMEGGE